MNPNDENMLSFIKYQGTGNDFIIIDDWEKEWVYRLAQKEIKRMCDRHFGVGADGLMLLQKDSEVDYNMVYYNADGRESTLCGNGSRCLAHFAHEKGRISGSGLFRAVDGLHKVEIRENGIVDLEMRPVMDLKKVGADWEVNTGSPHYVKFVEQVDLVPVVEWGQTIRNQPNYRKEGINVNFVQRLKRGIQVRTYERGVENETLSCGTGVTASALSFAKELKENASSVDVVTKGGKLSVRYEKEGDGFTGIWLCGPATPVFSGVIDPVSLDMEIL